MDARQTASYMTVLFRFSVFYSRGSSSFTESAITNRASQSPNISDQ